MRGMPRCWAVPVAGTTPHRTSAAVNRGGSDADRTVRARVYLYMYRPLPPRRARVVAVVYGPD